ncbi:Hypothetical predicted protein [Xyrichtys novacula]|uniref:Uncharacterized protein n=1 Tax=Xyrichtys novacula TaxID=13765 RepID=A0AAV1EJM5_XYRNO|nr:Hypothetical predicted protein [Xyrichtys novacula]
MWRQPHATLKCMWTPAPLESLLVSQVVEEEIRPLPLSRPAESSSLRSLRLCLSPASLHPRCVSDRTGDTKTKTSTPPCELQTKAPHSADASRGLERPEREPHIWMRAEPPAPQPPRANIQSGSSKLSGWWAAAC